MWFQPGVPYTSEKGRLSKQGALYLPHTITLSTISRLPVPCLPRPQISPAPPGLDQATLPTQPLTVQLSLANTVYETANTVYETAQLPDRRVGPSSLRWAVEGR